MSATIEAATGGRLPPEVIDKARATDLVSLIQSYGVELDRHGSEWSALCPFHNEKSPSFTVNPGKGFYHCFGCGAHGDPIEFVTEFEGVGFRDAVKKLVGNLPPDTQPRTKRDIERDEPAEWVAVNPVPDSAPLPMDTLHRKLDGKKWTKLISNQRWEYRNADGSLIGYVYRFNKPGGGKEVMPQVYCANKDTGELQWRWLSFPKPRPLYGLDKLARNPSAQVVVVEGEKACDAAQARFIDAGVSESKLVVVSWPGGGKAVKHTDFSPLWGRRVGLWPDSDLQTYIDKHPKAGEVMPFLEQPGTVAMLDIFDAIRAKCDGVKLFLPRAAGIPDGWDLADDLPDGFNLLKHVKTRAMPAEDVRKRFSMEPSISAADCVQPVWLVPPTDHDDLQRATFAADVFAMLFNPRAIAPRGVMFREYEGLAGLKAALDDTGRFLPDARVHVVIPHELRDEAVTIAQAAGTTTAVLQDGEQWVDALWATVTAQTRLQEPAIVAEPAEGEAGASAEQAARMDAPECVTAPPLRTIQVIAGELPRVVDDAELALLEQCSDLYQRAGSIVRPAMVRIEVADGRQIEGVRLVMVKKHHLAERLTAAAKWVKFDGRSQDFVPMDAPLKVAETYAAREGLWKLRTLAGVVNAPTLRADGSILDQHGFDVATGLLFEPGSCVFESVPDQPTKDDADEALSRLEELVESFPFVAASDQAVALSAILTACIRRSLPTAPMHAFSAPAAGSGKSMLVDVASIIACGRQAAVLSQGRDEAEAEKRIGSALLAGDQVLSLDNCTSPLDGELLCQVHTQPTVRLRILGASELRDVPTNTAMFATGNCLVVQGDMTRRVLLCSLDPKCERPELREFAFNPMDMARAGRAAYLRDALTVLRAFHVAGRPRQANPLGSFEAWSNWIRGALLWLGRPDPAETMEKARQSDPKLEALRAVMHQWGEVIGSDRITIANLIKRAIETEPSYGPGKPAFRHEGLREALLTIAGQGGAINSRALGRWLSAHKDKIVDGMRFQQVGKWQGVALWSLTGGESSASTPF